MKKYRKYLLLMLGIILVCVLAPMSVHAEDAGTSNGSKLSDWNYTENADGSITVTGYHGDSKDIVVPGKLDGKQVKINKKTFHAEHRLNSVVIGSPKEKVLVDGTDLSEAFWCADFSSIDLSGLDTAGVTNMNYFFDSCEKLKHLNLSGLDTSAVKNTVMMFRGCKSLTELDLSDFDTRDFRNMSYMFYVCDNLERVDLSSFDTSKATDMRAMFSGCKSLKTIDVSNFNTSNVTCMAGMFADCKIPAEIDVSNFDTSNVTDMSGMFMNCSGLTKLDLSNFDTSKVANTRAMFWGCSELTKLDLSNFDMSTLGSKLADKPTTKHFVSEMFLGCNKLQFMNLSFDRFIRSQSTVFDTTLGKALPTIIITQNDDVKSYSPDAGKTIGNERIPYVATVKLDANGGVFAEKAADTEKMITFGGNIFYDTMDAYKNEFTVTSDKIAKAAANPTKGADKFEGWYLDKDCTKPFTTLDMTLGHDNEVTLYAGYEKGSTIKINPIAEKPYDGKQAALTADNCTITGSTGDITFTYEQKVGDTWKKIDGAPVNAGTYRVKATLAADATYKGAESDYMEFTIKKATPKYEVPKGLEAIEGQTLADVKLPQGFTWDKDATTSVGAPGNQEFTVTYTPDDTDNFEVVKDIKVTIKVHMKWIALNEIPVINATDKTLTEGDKFDPKEGVTASDKEDGDLTDQIKIADNTVNTSKAGIYSVMYQVTDKDGATATKTINVVVKAKAVPPTTVKQDGSTKTGDVSSPYFWAVVAIIALIGAAVTLLIKRKGIRSH